MAYRRQQTGLSLIEVMVGLVIGLVALLVIGQTMAVFEGDKRTSTGGADAQTNGYAALMAMERNIRMAGTGLVAGDGRLACEGETIRQFNTTTAEPPASSPPNGFLPPIRIIGGGAAAGGDVIVLVRSNVEYGAPMPSMLKTPFSYGTTACVTQAGVQPNTSAGELFLIAPDHTGNTVDLAVAPTAASRCYLVQASATPVAGAAPCTVAEDFSFDTALTQPFNTAADTTITVPAGHLLIALGQSPYIRYGVGAGAHANKLMLAEQMAFVAGSNTYTDDNRFTDDIVFIAAQYGIDTDCTSTTSAACNTDADQSVDTYVAPSGVWAHTALTPANFTRIKAIRLAVVARSPQYNKDLVDVSSAAFDLWQKINPGDATPPQFNPTTLPDGDHYRYRVFETVIPLKNMIWGRL